MGRSKKPRVKRKPPPRLPPPEPSRPLLLAYNLLKNPIRWLGRALEHSWKLLVFLSVVGGVLASAFFFLPRIAVDPGSPSDPSNPWGSATFIVANTGIIPLENVSAQFAVCYLTFEGGKKIAGENYGDCNRHSVAGDTSEKWKNHRLEIDGKWTLSLLDIFPTPLKDPDPISLDGAIMITYTPKYFLIPWSKEFRFRANRQQSGQVVWFHTTIDKD